MAINDFRLNIKTTANDQKITSIIESFMKGNVRLVNDGDGLINLYKHDVGSMGVVNHDDYIALKNVFVMDSIRNKGIDLESISSQEEKTKLLQSTDAEIINNLNSDYDLVLSTKGVLSNDDSNNLNHTIILNVKADDFITVLSSLYESLKFRVLDDVRIVTPTVSTVKYGFTRTILIKCNSKDLEYTVDMVEGLNQDIISKCREVPVIYPSYNGWFGYETEDKEENKNSTLLISKIVYDAIKYTVDELAKNDDLKIGEQKLREYIDSVNIKPFAYKDILNAYKDKLIPVIIEVFKDKLDKSGVNLANIYELPSVTKELDSIYGPIDYSILLNSAILENETLQTIKKESVVKVPVNFDIPKEITELDKQYSEAIEDEAYLDSLLETVSPTVDLLPNGAVNFEDDKSMDSEANITEEGENPSVDSVSPDEFSVIELLEPKEPSGPETLNDDSLMNEKVVDGILKEETTSLQDDVQEIEVEVDPDVQEIEVEVDPDFQVKHVNRKVELKEIPEFLKKDNILLNKVQSKKQTKESNGIVFPEIPVMDDQEVDLKASSNNQVPVVDSEEIINIGSNSNVELPIVVPKVSEEPLVVEPVVQEEKQDENQIMVTIPGDYLTDSEIASVVSDATLTKEYSNDYSKYELFVDDINKLSLNVKSTDLTVYDYFEKYGLLDKMESTDLIELHPELGEPVDPKTFISNNLIDYLTKNGSGDLDYVIGLYASGIKKINPDEKKLNTEEKKRTLFPSIFKK